MQLINGLPYEYREINLHSSAISPSTAHCKNNLLTMFFFSYLMERVMSVYDFTIPKEIDLRYFKGVLFYNGWILGTYDKRFGAIAHYGAITGKDFYYRPKKATIILTSTDPVENYTLEKILNGTGQNAVLVGMRETYRPITDLVMFYAEKMALTYESFDTNIINAKLAYVMGTDNKALSETFKKLYDNIAGGQTACVVDKDLFNEDYTPRWQVFFNNLKSNYIGSDLLIDLSKIRKEFDTDVGLPNANTDKKERATDDEINSNNLETLTRVEMWRDNINSGLKRLGELFEDWQGSEVKLRTLPANNIGSIIEGVSDSDFMRGGETSGEQ